MSASDQGPRQSHHPSYSGSRPSVHGRYTAEDRFPADPALDPWLQLLIDEGDRDAQVDPDDPRARAFAERVLTAWRSEPRQQAQDEQADPVGGERARPAVWPWWAFCVGFSAAAAVGFAALLLWVVTAGDGSDMRPPGGSAGPGIAQNPPPGPQLDPVTSKPVLSVLVGEASDQIAQQPERLIEGLAKGQRWVVGEEALPLDQWMSSQPRAQGPPTPPPPGAAHPTPRLARGQAPSADPPLQ